MNARLFNPIDLIAVPIALMIILVFLFLYKKRQPSQLQSYFYKAFFLRVLGTFCLAAIFQFIYGYGDHFFYYYCTQSLNAVFRNDPATWFKLLFTHPATPDGDSGILLGLISDFDKYSYYVYQGPENANVAKIASVFDLLCFNSYLAIALFFGTLSFLGCWNIFKTFVHVFPGYEKQFSWICLYLPSLWFWGSGLLKDPICIFGLGILFYNFFVKHHSFLWRVLLICLGTFLLMSIKSYIFYSFAAAVGGGWILYHFKKFNILLKTATIVLFGLALALAYPLISNLITESFDDIVKTSSMFLSSYAKTGSEGDATIIPVFDPTPAGFAKLGMQGLMTVYLRPFPWEVRKILYLFLILENLALYYIIFKKIKVGPMNFAANYRLVLNFCFVFFLFLGIVIGVTTFNLGTIARYRVPALPFLFGAFFCLKLANRKKKAEKASGLSITVVPMAASADNTNDLIQISKS